MSREEMPIKIAQAITEAFRLLQNDNSLTTRLAANRACGSLGLDQRMCEPIHLLISKCIPESIEWAKDVL
jgi:hypothetical protein